MISAFKPSSHKGMYFDVRQTARPISGPVRVIMFTAAILAIVNSKRPVLQESDLVESSKPRA
jgi:hypothetical protein